MASPKSGVFKRPDGFAFAYKLHGSSFLDGSGRGAKKSGRPLVMINGLSATMAEYSPLADRLGDERPVLIFDNRGMGGSSVHEDFDHDVQLQDLADDAVKLIQHFGWKEVDLLGFSMGGMILQTLLLTPNLPFKIAHVILAATSAKSPRSELMQAMPDPSIDRSAYTEEDRKKDLIPFFEKNYDVKWMADPKNQELLQRRLTDGVRENRPQQVVVSHFIAVSQYDVRQRLSEIPTSLPVLIIHGGIDKAVFPSEKRYILEGIKHAKVAKTPNEEYGHIWYDYFTTEFWVRTIGDFLNDVPEGHQKAKL